MPESWNETVCGIRWEWWSQSHQWWKDTCVCGIIWEWWSQPAEKAASWWQWWEAFVGSATFKKYLIKRLDKSSRGETWAAQTWWSAPPPAAPAPQHASRLCHPDISNYNDIVAIFGLFQNIVNFSTMFFKELRLWDESERLILPRGLLGHKSKRGSESFWRQQGIISRKLQ